MGFKKGTIQGDPRRGAGQRGGTRNDGAPTFVTFDAMINDCAASKYVRCCLYRSSRQPAVFLNSCYRLASQFAGACLGRSEAAFGQGVDVSQRCRPSIASCDNMYVVAVCRPCHCNRLPSGRLSSFGVEHCMYPTGGPIPQRSRLCLVGDVVTCVPIACRIIYFYCRKRTCLRKNFEAYSFVASHLWL